MDTINSETKDHRELNKSPYLSLLDLCDEAVAAGAAGRYRALALPHVRAEPAPSSRDIHIL